MVEIALLTNLFEKLKNRHAYVVFAESLTAGLISAEFSKIPGSSSVLWGGFVVYSPEAKEKLLGVSKSLIEKCGVVSEECVLAMAEGALKVSFTETQSFTGYSLAVTGVAGPPSPFDEADVGTVYIAVAKTLNTGTEVCFDGNTKKSKQIEFCSEAKLFHFVGDRNAVREQTVNNGVKMLLDMVVG